MHVVVRPHRPTRQFVLGTVSVLLLALAGWLLFDYGQWRYIYMRMAASDESQDLWRLSRESERDNKHLRERLAVAERTAEVDREAISQLQIEVKRLQTEILDLREELEFYRGTLTSGGASSGYRIQGLQLRPWDGENEYRFKLVLTHLMPDDRQGKGVLDIALSGRLGADAKRYAMNELNSGLGYPLSFELKHFRRFEGRFSIPRDFKPSQLVISVRDSNNKKKLLERTFDWALTSD